MVRLLTKQEGEDITAFKPAVSIGNIIPTSAVANHIVVSDGQGHVQDSGVGIDSLYNLGVPKQIIPSGADLNDYTTEGVYQFGGASSIANLPRIFNGTAWICELVVKKYNENKIKQYINIYNNENAHLTRVMNNGVWYDWEQLIYASQVGNPNLLANGDFKLNTQGKTSYSGSGYGIDSWTSASTYLLVTINDDSITLTNNSSSVNAYYGQFVKGSSLLGQVVTVSLQMEDGTFYQCAGTVPSNVTTSTQGIKDIVTSFGELFMELRVDGTIYVCIKVSSGASATLKNVKLELGSVATPCVPTNTYEEYVKIYGTQHLSNPNLLINGDFRINQRNGYYAPIGTTYTVNSDLSTSGGVGTTTSLMVAHYYSDTVRKLTWSTGEVRYVATSDCLKGYVGTGYGVDMWTSNSASTVVTVNNDNTITVSANGGTAYWQQFIENPERLFGKQLTWSIEDVDGNIYSNTFTALSETPTANTSLGTLKINDNVSFRIQWYKDGRVIIYVDIKDGYSITLKYIKLELGTVATPNTPRSIGEELALCQRYLCLSGTDTSSFGMVGFPYYISTNGIYFFIPTPVSMQGGTPSIIGSMNTEDGWGVYNSKGELQTGFTFSSAYARKSGISVNLSKTSHGLDSGAVIRFCGRTGFSREL